MSIQPKKSLGQNFLQDKNIAQKIVQSLFAGPDDLVIEIGPGTGALTQFLYRSYPNYKAIELDNRAVDLLRVTYPGIQLIEQSVLDVNFSDYRTSENQRIFVIGNIPYYITSPILFHLFDQAESIHQAVIMMQLEVAQRLIAQKRTKEYGILTIQTEFFSAADILFKVPRQVFYPQPNVDSAVVSFMMHQKQHAEIITEFKLLVRTAFNQRRKKLSNALKILGLNSEVFDEWKDKRAEELTSDEFIRMAELFKESTKLA